MTEAQMELNNEGQIQRNLHFGQQTICVGHRRIQWTHAHGPTPYQSQQGE